MSFAARTIGRSSGGVPFLTVFNSEASSVTGFVNVTMDALSDGRLSISGNGGVSSGSITPNPGWFSETTTGIGNNYEIRVTLVSGTFSGGTVGSWLALTSTRSWNVQTASAGSKTVNFNIEIRLNGGSVVATANNCSITSDSQA